MTGLVDLLDTAAAECRSVRDVPDPHALLVAALGASEATIGLGLRIVDAGIEANDDKRDPKPPPPPPPPPPKGEAVRMEETVTIPPWLRTKIAEAEAAARDLLTQAGHVAARSRAIDQALIELHQIKGGDDRAFDRLMTCTDTLVSIENDIIAVLKGYPGG